MDGRPTRIVEVDTLRDLMERLLRVAGCDEENAKIVASVFLEADLKGIGLQGFDHMPSMLANLRTGRTNPIGKPRIVDEGDAFAVVDGDLGPGQVAGIFAADLVAAKAKAAGSAVVGVKNSSDMFMIGYYGERIARAGVVGLVFSDAPPLVHPFGGIERMMGTNPFSIGIPTEDERPFVLDIATSALSFSRIRQAAYHGEDVAEGMGVGPDGKPTREAAAIAKGAIAPLAGHKGFGLSLCVALLSGPLVGAATGPAHRAWHGDAPSAPSKGHLFIAIDPAIFGAAAAFRAAANAYLQEVKDSKKAPGVDEIRIPGQTGQLVRERSLREGVTMYEAVWQKMKTVAADFGVEMPD
jgi:ureidoglycolate dehydrogenase (NAD+)